MPRLDRVTRAFWRAAGRPVDLAGDHAWLDAPMHAGPRIGEAWLADAAASYGGRVDADDPEAGLLAAMADLDGPGFRAADLREEVRDFYEHTAGWDGGVNPVVAAVPAGGELVSRLFGRRVQQLALPTRPLDVAHGMDSRVSVLRGADGAQRAAAWLRTPGRPRRRAARRPRAADRGRDRRTPALQARAARGRVGGPPAGSAKIGP